MNAIATPDLRSLSADETRQNRAALADILVDCVEGGDSLGFMSPLGRAEAAAYWDGIADEVAAGDTVLLVADSEGEMLGTVQLAPASKPNQPHRADVKKLLVHSRARRRGLGRRLMGEVEDEALRRGRWLLCLDSSTGSVAEQMYPRLGWTAFGIVPDYALWPAGGLCDVTFFYKRLEGSPS
jgi:GNAT superfamily N-acetyltransferase